MIGVICQHRSGHTAYERWLAKSLQMSLQKEVDINMKDQSIEKYLKSLPQNSIVSFMVRPNIEKHLDNNKHINWRLLIRKDWYTQCLSFLYTNKTQMFRENQSTIVEVDTKLIKYFFEMYEIIENLKTKKYPVFYYEDIEIPINPMDHNQIRKNNNKYSKMISNIDEVDYKIYEYNYNRM